ncbi:MAG: hypothetical protein OJF49_001341 [Ktedonobacterales bacterium]|jgi:hypothetical protein|nr:MAG: hypothetical protein OJF49_001341 [Ktedonobacterales bacterium]
MSFLNFPAGTVLVVPNLFRAWVCIVRDHDGLGELVPATNADDLLEDAASFLKSFGPTDLDGGVIRVCPPELAAKAVFSDIDFATRERDT